MKDFSHDIGVISSRILYKEDHFVAYLWREEAQRLLRLHIVDPGGLNSIVQKMISDLVSNPHYPKEIAVECLSTILLDRESFGIFVLETAGLMHIAKEKAHEVAERWEEDAAEAESLLSERFPTRHFKIDREINRD